MDVVKIINLSKTFGVGTTIEVQALKHVNVTMEQGKFIAIVGPSGSGKSTLLHLLGGLEKPTSGEIIVNSKNLLEMTDDELAEYRRREVGFVFQKYNLIPILNAKENIVLPLSLGQESVDESHFNKIIELLKIGDRLAHMPGELSGGQQQRVAIARALIAKPSIILADEPTGNLDYKSSEEICDYLKMLSREFGQTIIMITHDRILAEKADTIHEIIDGKMVGI